eukprot:4858782-Prymnesium_polylepis.1
MLLRSQFSGARPEWERRRLEHVLRERLQTIAADIAHPSLHRAAAGAYNLCCFLFAVTATEEDPAAKYKYYELDEDVAAYKKLPDLAAPYGSPLRWLYQLIINTDITDGLQAPLAELLHATAREEILRPADSEASRMTGQMAFVTKREPWGRVLLTGRKRSREDGVQLLLRRQPNSGAIDPTLRALSMFVGVLNGEDDYRDVQERLHEEGSDSDEDSDEEDAPPSGGPDDMWDYELPWSQLEGLRLLVKLLRADGF